MSADMTAEQAARSADQTATILRGLAAAYEAERLETWIAWYCEPGGGRLSTFDRITDLSEARDALTRAVCMHVAYTSIPSDTFAHDMRGRSGSAYGVRASAYLARVAWHAHAALQGEPAQIPSSDGLGPYPPPSAT